jgi:hypothetical protein
VTNETEPAPGRRIGLAEQFWQWCRRNPKVAALAAGNVVLLVCAAVASTLAAVKINEDRRSAESGARRAQQEKLAVEHELEQALDEIRRLKQNPGDETEHVQ